MTPTLTICQLYPKLMNTYGDWGNVLTLARRAESQGLNVHIQEHNVGDSTDFSQVDLITGGGTQDSAQRKAHPDLLKNAHALIEQAESGMPMLLIHGMYQLFGSNIQASTGETISGLGIFDASTTLGKERLIGNIAVKTREFGTLLGYENHLGYTRLRDSSQALGTCAKGTGNDPETGNEGARVNNVIGSYLHGALLPKNPILADFLVETAVQRKDPTWAPSAPEDPALTELTKKAREVAASRPR